jgi:hypothetical protein
VAIDPAVQKHLRESIVLLVSQLNRELELAEICRVNVAVDADNTIGRPCKVKVYFGENSNANHNHRD